MQEITIGLYIRGGKVACVTHTFGELLPGSTSLILADVDYIYLYIDIDINNISMALPTYVSDIQCILCQTASSKA